MAGRKRMAMAGIESDVGSWMNQVVRVVVFDGEIRVRLEVLEHLAVQRRVVRHLQQIIGIMQLGAVLVALVEKQVFIEKVIIDDENVIPPAVFP